jgi:tRNA(Ile)-lysidine synthase
MAVSARTRRAPDALAARLRKAVERSVHAALETPGASAGAVGGSGIDRPLLEPSPRRAPRPAPPAARSDAPLLVAYSGGPDSAALLDLACRCRDARVMGFGRLQAVHVHHGLHRDADTWAAHCAAFCAARNVPLHEERVSVQRRVPSGRAGPGVEAAARDARYQALLRVAQAQGARVVLTAHHLEDRLETFVLQWLRGAGLDGLAGPASIRPLARAAAQSTALPRAAAAPAPAPAHTPLPQGAADVPAVLLRPFLAVPRTELAQYVRSAGLAVVNDPANVDPAVARTALRSAVMPALEGLRSGFRQSAARSMDLIGEAAAALDALGNEDLAQCCENAPDGMLGLDRLGALAPARQLLVLRRWLARWVAAPPPRDRLLQLLRQALQARSDARVSVRIGAIDVRRHRRFLLVRPWREAATDAPDHAILWRGELELALPQWAGVLRFETVAAGVGFDPQWLREQPLTVRARTGGERFKPHPIRPSRTLKRLFQDAGIAEFQRAALPLVWRDGHLVFVAGLGADVRYLDDDGQRVVLRWVPDMPLIAPPAASPVARPRSTGPATGAL